MYFPNFYSILSEDEIEAKIREEGFEPKRFHNSPGDIYEPHQHSETALIAYLVGSMKVKVGDKNYICRKGDKLFIPGNTIHSAVVGKEGCTFFWDEKLMKLYEPGLK